MTCTTQAAGTRLRCREQPSSGKLNSRARSPTSGGCNALGHGDGNKGQLPLSSVVIPTVIHRDVQNFPRLKNNYWYKKGDGSLFQNVFSRCVLCEEERKRETEGRKPPIPNPGRKLKICLRRYIVWSGWIRAWSCELLYNCWEPLQGLLQKQ